MPNAAFFQIRQLCRDLDAAGYVPEWSVKNLLTVVRHRFKVNDFSLMTDAQTEELQEHLAGLLAAQLGGRPVAGARAAAAGRINE